MLVNFKNGVSLIVFVLFCCLAACTSPETEKLRNENARLRAEQDLQKNLQRDADSLMLLVGSYMDSMRVLQGDLNNPKEKGLKIVDKRNKIAQLEELLANSQRELNLLQNRLSRLQLENSGLKKLVTQLQADIVVKEQEIEVLKQENSTLKTNVSSLRQVVVDKEDVIGKQQNEISERDRKILEAEQMLNTEKLEKTKAQIANLTLSGERKEAEADKISGLFSRKKKVEAYQQAVKFYRQANQLAQDNQLSAETTASQAKIDNVSKKMK